MDHTKIIMSTDGRSYLYRRKQELLQRLRSFRRPYQTCCLHLHCRQQLCQICRYPFTETCGGTCPSSDLVQL